MPNLEPVIADVLIVTITDVESRAVLEAFKQATGHIATSITLGDRVYRDLGTINGAKVFMALSEMGAGGLGAAQQAVQKSVATLQPHAVIMVGIAFGTDENKQRIGDILVSKQLMLYEPQKVSKDGKTQDRGDRVHSTPRLINYLQNANLDWQGAKVRFGLVLTGEKLVDDLDFRESLKKLEPEAIGGEMEGARLYVSCQDAKVDWILVKAICDWADGNKDHDKKPRQQQAAKNAAVFVLHALQHAPLIRSTSHRSEPPKVDLTRLPKPATNKFIGRQAELAKLNATFNNRAETGIVAIIADGGIGKSALTDEWINKLKKTDYDGIRRVFAWSFYSQGSHQQTFTNTQAFFSIALPFFGFAGKLPQNDDDKARELAKCLNAESALLLLDGLEPLQHPPQIGGEMADVGMKEFLLQLDHHRHPQTFVLISSRQALVELDRREDYQAIPLDTLSDSDGAELLQELKVQGTTVECQTVSRDLNGHALSLVLLAMLLTQHKGGDIRYAKELPALDSDSKQSGHAKRVLTYYDRLLNDRERRFMHCLALFDRPMHWQEQQALFAKSEHAAPLVVLSDSAWQTLQDNLEAKGLLLGSRGEKTFAPTDDQNHHRTQWDTHPLIRQFFLGQFQQQHSEAFQQAHLVLFDYFLSIPEQERPDTLAELEPLYRAVMHGCLAGDYRKAKEAYEKRIRRDSEAYSLYKLGAYSQDLIALQAFFPKGWTLPISSEFSKVEKAWLLQVSSYCLI